MCTICLLTHTVYDRGHRRNFFFFEILENEFLILNNTYYFLILDNEFPILENEFVILKAQDKSSDLEQHLPFGNIK